MNAVDCGFDRHLFEALIKSVIYDMIEQGIIQGGLLQCDGEKLPGKRQVPQCEEIPEMVCRMIEEGVICLPYPETLAYECESGDLVMTLTSGVELRTSFKCPDSTSGKTPKPNPNNGANNP